MTRSIYAAAAMACLLLAGNVSAQEKTTEEKKDEGKGIKHRTISVGTDGIKIRNKDTTTGMKMYKGSDGDADKDNETKKSRFSSNVMMLDLGFNVMQDNTNYANLNPYAKSYMNVPAGSQNKSLFDMRPGKSINVNIYPWMVRFAAIRTHNQRMYISTGVGLQLYNFRYESPLTYTKSPTGVILDTIAFKKDKLGMDYLNIPLMLTFKTRLYKDNWLVYGAGITGGYRIATWNKQVSDARGKTKVHDAFGTADFNSCVTAEIGIDGMFRFYASYQLTSLYQNGFDQHPVSFGFRFSGI